MKFTFAAETEILADPLDHVLTFGKHKGLSLRKLSCTWSGRNYIKYMSTVSDPDEGARMQSALDNTPAITCTLEEAGSTVLRFGKYRGSSLSEVVSKEGGLRYLKWTCEWEKCPAELSTAVPVILDEYNKQLDQREK
jgi:hypothetical protein